MHHKHTRLMTGTRWMHLLVLWLAWGAVAPANAADDYARDWGPQLGTPMPLLEAQDQAGASRTLDNLQGEQGLLLFLSRSADW